MRTIKPKQNKVLFQLQGPERKALEQARDEVGQAVRAFRQILAFIAQRERIPNPLFFNEERMAFELPPKQGESPASPVPLAAVRAPAQPVRMSRAERRQLAKQQAKRLRKG